MARRRRVDSYIGLLVIGGLIVAVGIIGLILSITVGVLAFTEDTGDYRAAGIAISAVMALFSFVVIAAGEVLIALRDIARNTARIP
jgi:hypothetical protein